MTNELEQRRRRNKRKKKKKKKRDIIQSKSSRVAYESVENFDLLTSSFLDMIRSSTASISCFSRIATFQFSQLSVIRS